MPRSAAEQIELRRRGSKAVDDLRRWGLSRTADVLADILDEWSQLAQVAVIGEEEAKENDALRAIKAAFAQYIVRFGIEHVDECPEDDTCECDHVRQINDAFAKARPFETRDERTNAHAAEADEIVEREGWAADTEPPEPRPQTDHEQATDRTRDFEEGADEK